LFCIAMMRTKSGAANSSVYGTRMPSLGCSIERPPPVRERHSCRWFLPGCRAANRYLRPRVHRGASGRRPSCKMGK
jgi:hypothetical protein